MQFFILMNLVELHKTQRGPNLVSFHLSVDCSVASKRQFYVEFFVAVCDRVGRANVY